MMHCKNYSVLHFQPSFIMYLRLYADFCCQACKIKNWGILCLHQVCFTIHIYLNHFGYQLNLRRFSKLLANFHFVCFSDWDFRTFYCIALWCRRICTIFAKISLDAICNSIYDNRNINVPYFSSYSSWCFFKYCYLQVTVTKNFYYSFSRVSISSFFYQMQTRNIIRSHVYVRM